MKIWSIVSKWNVLADCSLNKFETLITAISFRSTASLWPCAEIWSYGWVRATNHKRRGWSEEIAVNREAKRDLPAVSVRVKSYTQSTEFPITCTCKKWLLSSLHFPWTYRASVCYTPVCVLATISSRKHFIFSSVMMMGADLHMTSRTAEKLSFSNCDISMNKPHFRTRPVAILCSKSTFTNYEKI